MICLRGLCRPEGSFPAPSQFALCPLHAFHLVHFAPPCAFSQPTLPVPLSLRLCGKPNLDFRPFSLSGLTPRSDVLWMWKSGNDRIMAGQNHEAPDFIILSGHDSACFEAFPPAASCSPMASTS